MCKSISSRHAGPVAFLRARLSPTSVNLWCVSCKYMPGYQSKECQFLISSIYFSLAQDHAKFDCKCPVCAALNTQTGSGWSPNDSGVSGSYLFYEDTIVWFDVNTTACRWKYYHSKPKLKHDGKNGHQVCYPTLILSRTCKQRQNR